MSLRKVSLLVEIAKLQLLTYDSRTRNEYFEAALPLMTSSLLTYIELAA